MQSTAYGTFIIVAHANVCPATSSAPRLARRFCRHHHRICGAHVNPSSYERTKLTHCVVSWNWGGGAPGGKVAEKKTEGEIAIKSKRGNTIKKNAEPNNPAVHIERSGNDVVKKASELNIEKKASSGGKKKDDSKKRKADDEEEDEKPEKEEDEHEEHDGKEVRKGGKTPSKAGGAAASKKQKAEDKKEEKPKANGEKKAKGRPKGSGGEKKEKKQPAERKAGDMVSTRTRSQGKK